MLIWEVEKMNLKICDTFDWREKWKVKDTEN